VLLFREAGTVIGGAMAAIAQAAQGHFSEAKDIIKATGTDMKQMAIDSDEASKKFEDSLWNSTKAVEEHGEALEQGTKHFQPFNASAQKVANTLEELRTKLEAQSKIWVAAGSSMEDYKRVQDEVSIQEELLKMKLEGAGKAALTKAEGFLRAAQIVKQGTADEVAGLQLIDRLRTEQIGLTTHQTSLEKTLAEIRNHPGMSQAEKEEATALAETNAQLESEERLKKELAGLDQQAAADMEKEKMALTLSSNALKLYNQEMALRKKAQDAIKNDPANEKAITAELNKQVQALKDANTQTVQWTQSFAGLQAGAQQAFANMAQGAMNMNKLGGQLVTTFNTGLTDALMKAAQGGKDAFKELIASMGELIAKQLLGVAIIEAEAAVLKAYGVDPNVIATLMGTKPVASANGNAFAGGTLTAFAVGGVVGGPTMFNMGLMGEAGPEAIMPLQRDSSGKLGVAASGSSNSPSEVHYHAPSITIQSNQDPHEIGKQVRKQLKLHEALTKSVIAKQQRPGGMLHQRSPMLA
jgi:lambda family phage tail tape measure protein